MATLTKNRDTRANDIVVYYNSVATYNSDIDADGTDLDINSPQAKFKAFNDLIKLYHDELKVSIGYPTSVSSYMPSDEGVPLVAPWWSNANISNQRSELFFIDVVYAGSYGAYYMLNGQSEPAQRVYYSLWNQYSSALGGYGNFGYKNYDPVSSYSDTYNPFQSGSNFRMKEPIEYYGDANDVLWGAIVFDGRHAYRNRKIGNTSYISHSDTGFNNYESVGVSLDILLNTFTDSNLWPSPFEIFRYTYWGLGTNTVNPNNPITISNHTASGENGSFDTSLGLGQLFSTNEWYSIYSSSDPTKGWVVYIASATLMGVSPFFYRYTYTSAHWATPVTGDFNAAGWITYRDPSIYPGVKTGSITDGRVHIWTGVYNTYYSSVFKLRADAISSKVSSWATALGNIAIFDYTVILQEAGSRLGFNDTQNFKTQLDAWLPEWKISINDTGSGSTYSAVDANWSDANLDNLFTDPLGGLNILITFATNYTGSQSGYISSRRSQIYTLLGDYTKGSDEVWTPDQISQINNNTGFFTSNSLYNYRFNYLDARLNRETGILTEAATAYKTYTLKLTQIAALESTMSAQTTDHKYDVTPSNFSITKDNENQIVLSWDAVKAASSYNIDRKESISGSWTRIASAFGYVDPGNPPDFSHNPPSEYTDVAYTQGHEGFGLTIIDPDSSTGLFEDFTIYDFNLALDGATAIDVSIRGMDAKTWNALIVALQKKFQTMNLTVTASIASGDIVLTSDKKGTGSSIALIAGTTNNIFAALSTTPTASVPSSTILKQGKVYYYRARLNNGWDDGEYILDSDVPNGKDWDSQSEYQMDNYITSDHKNNGEAGIIVWDEPSNLQASGVDLGLAPSDIYTLLTWNASLNAHHYKIFRATSIDGGYALIGTTVSTSYQDATGLAGFIYYYKVSAISDTDNQLYDNTGNFSGAIESIKTVAGVRGKKLWQTITLSTSTTDRNNITLSWNALMGANGYLIYKAPIEEGQYSYLANDDATEFIVSNTNYVDAQPARQFINRTFAATGSGLLSSEYIANHRYYFIVICTGLQKEATAQQYFITSPNSGTWSCQAIVNSVQTALNNGLNNVNCELVYLINPAPASYRIRFTTKSGGTDTSISVLDGTFGDSLLTLVNGTLAAEIGQGAYPAIPTYYKVQAVYVSGGEILRRSEYSNIAEGFRPVL